MSVCTIGLLLLVVGGFIVVGSFITGYIGGWKAIPLLVLAVVGAILFAHSMRGQC